MDQWQEPCWHQALGEIVMYVTCGETCTKITSDEAVEINELKTSQEEADTRILLHANHALSDVYSIVIIAEDTDILVLSLAFHETISCNMFIKCGTKPCTRYIDVTKVAKSLGKRCATLCQECMPSQAVIRSVHSVAVEKLEL